MRAIDKEEGMLSGSEMLQDFAPPWDGDVMVEQLCKDTQWTGQ